MSDKKRVTFQGKTLSPGLGKGKTFVYRDVLKQVDEFYKIEEKQVDVELDRLIKAIKHIAEELNELAGHVEEEVDADLSDVFRAHAAIVQDDSLRGEVEKEIRDELVSAGSAVRSVFRRWERRFHSMEAEVAQQKGDDIRDLAGQLVSSLAGIRGHALDHVPDGCVLVARRLLPSDTIYLSRRNAAAAVLEEGGMGSHAALFAHEVGLPCVVGIPGVVKSIRSGEMALVDADSGAVVVHPNPEDIAVFQNQIEQRDHIHAEARIHAQEPAVTEQGTTINVFANIGGVNDTQAAVENGAEGIGLYRIEQVYLGCEKPPDTEQLLAELQQTLAPAKGMPVYVRLLDAGADKPLPFMEQMAESNPSLGLRGVRFLEAYPELLQTQLDALLALSKDVDLHLLIPMVTLPRDVKWVKDLLAESALKNGVSDIPKLGAMIETPAAALAAKDIARHADFLSFGTNDLTQYTFAADRENAAVDDYFDDTNEVVFRLLKMVHNDVPECPLSVCGELACRPAYVSKLLECGITTLSVAPPSIPEIKQAIRQSNAV